MGSWRYCKAGGKTHQSWGTTNSLCLDITRHVFGVFPFALMGWVSFLQSSTDFALESKGSCPQSDFPYVHADRLMRKPIQETRSLTKGKTLQLHHKRLYPNATKYLQTLKNAAINPDLNISYGQQSLKQKCKSCPSRLHSFSFMFPFESQTLVCLNRKQNWNPFYSFFWGLSFPAAEHFFPCACPDKISKPEVTVSLDLQGESSLSQHNTWFLN